MDGGLDGGASGAQGPDGGELEILDHLLAGIGRHLACHGEDLLQLGAVELQELTGLDCRQGNAGGFDEEFIVRLEGGVSASQEDVVGVRPVSA